MQVLQTQKALQISGLFYLEMRKKSLSKEVWAHCLRYHLPVRAEAYITHICGLVKLSVSAPLSRLQAGFSSLLADYISRSQFLFEYTENGFMVRCFDLSGKKNETHSLCNTLPCVYNGLKPLKTKQWLSSTLKWLSQNWICEYVHC